MATQRTQIFLEGVALDLDKNIDADFTYSIADIADFEKRTTTFSKTVTIPATAHNNFLFGSYFDFNIQNDYTDSLDNVGVNFNPLKKAFCKVTIDNIEVFAGVLRLLEITYKSGVIEYQCALFGSLGGLFTTIGDKLLTDLDLSDLTHDYNITNIIDTWTEVDPKYVYPLSQYGLGTNPSDSTYDVRNFRPAIFLKEVFNRIINQAGYSYEDTFWDENNLDKIIILNSDVQLEAYFDILNKVIVALYAAEYSYDEPTETYSADIQLGYSSIVTENYLTTGLSSGSVTFTNNTGKDVTVKVDVDLYYEGSTDQVVDIAATGTSYRLKRINSFNYGVYEQEGNNITILPVVFPSVVIGETYQMTANPDIVKNVTVTGINIDDNEIYGISDDSVTASGDYTAYYVDVNEKFSFTALIKNGQVFSMAGSNALSNPSLPSAPSFLIKGTSSITVTTVDPNSKLPVQYDGEISGKSLVPVGVKQSDFLKSVINALNLYIDVDKEDSTKLIFTPYPDFYIGETTDWSNKTSLNTGVSIKPPSEYLPKSYSFEYKDDVDYYSKLYKGKYNDNYGNKSFETANDFSKDDNSTQLLFSLSPLISNENHDRIMSAMFDINTDGTYKQIKTNPKLAFWGGVKSTTPSYTIKDGDTTLSTQNEYAYAGHIYDPQNTSDGRLWDLCFGSPKEIYFNISDYPTNNLFKIYYEDFLNMKINKDSKLITLYFLLNMIDIMNLDFRKYYKVDNGLYYLNMVDSYNPLANDLTRVELIRIA